MNNLTLALFAIWCITEVWTNLISFRNRSSISDSIDRFSYLAVWFAIVPPVGFAMLVWKQVIFTDGFSSLRALFPLLGYLGCVMMAFGITVRMAAVIALKRQFTTKVTIIEKHEIVDKGIYKILRHPAYLGELMVLLGIGLVSGNWISLIALTALPLAAILYRIHVEEMALLRHFGSAYQAYMNRTERLIPGIW